MIRLRNVTLISVMLAFGGQYLRSDEFPIIDGRVSQECPVMEIKLTNLQSKLVGRKYSPGMILFLTKSQITILKSKAKIKIGPTKLKIYRASELSGSCTCGLANFALPFKPGHLEVPIGYLCSDKEAKDREITD